MKAFVLVVFVCCSGYCFSQVSVDSVLREMGRINEDFEYSKELLVEIPGTSVKIMHPEHFLLSEEIPGFIHIGTSATVQVNEIFGTSYIMIEEAMTEDHFKEQGVELKSKKEVELFDGSPGILYIVEFKSENRKYERLILFTGDYHNTIWINASYPIVSKEILQDVLLNSILTAQFN